MATISATVKQSELLKFLSTATQISPKKSDLEILTFTKVDISGDKIKLEVSNITYAAITHIPIEGLQPAENANFLIKTDLFFDCISSFTSENVDLLIDLDSHQITVKAALSKAKLRINTELVKDWRELKHADDSKVRAKINLLGSDLNQAIKLALISVGQPKVVLQPEFLNVCFNINPETKKLAVVSSDRFRLSLNNNELEYLENKAIINLEEPTSFILPAKVMALVSRVVPDDLGVEITLNTDDGWFKFDHTEVYTQFVDGKYPDYEKIIPQSFSCSLEVDKDELLKAIKQVYFLSRNQFNKDITFNIIPAEKKILVTSKADVLGESENQISILSIEGDQSDWQQSFNATYFLDYLGQINHKVLIWDANPGKPSVLYGKDSKDKGLYLVCGLNR